jgi:hypothetical protein
MKVTTKKLLLADPPTDRNITTYNKVIHRIIGAPCCRNLTQQHYDFAQNHWVFELCPSPGILEARKHNPSLGEGGGETPTLLK